MDFILTCEFRFYLALYRKRIALVLSQNGLLIVYVTITLIKLREHNKQAFTIR